MDSSIIVAYFLIFSYFLKVPSDHYYKIAMLGASCRVYHFLGLILITTIIIQEKISV
jgi:hypothetical protein